MQFMYLVFTFHIFNFLIQNTCLFEQPKHNSGESSVEIEKEFDQLHKNRSNDKFGQKFRNKKKRALVDPKLDEDGFTYYNIGVLMASRLDSPFDLERCGPAVDLGIEKINEKFLKHHKIKLGKVQER